MTPEGTIKGKLDRRLKKLGVWSYSPQAGPHGAAGIPDRILIVCGRFVGIECKADKTKKLTALQEAQRERILAAGGSYFVVCDDDTIAIALLAIEFLLNAGSPGQESTGP